MDQGHTHAGVISSTRLTSATEVDSLLARPGWSRGLSQRFERDRKGERCGEARHGEGSRLLHFRSLAL
jgi:hypothetical protein